MYLIPLGQPESVELVIHALRVAGGEADCTSCPVRRVCTKQCLTIAAAVAQMVAAGTLPFAGEPSPPASQEPPSPSPRPGLKVVK